MNNEADAPSTHAESKAHILFMSSGRYSSLNRTKSGLGVVQFVNSNFIETCWLG